MKTIAALTLLCVAFAARAQLGPGGIFVPGAGGTGGSLSNGYSFNGPFTVVNATNVYLHPSITNLVGTGSFTNSQQIFGLVLIVTNTGNAITSGYNLTNTVKRAGTLASASLPVLVKVQPGDYLTPANTVPSVMWAVDNVSTYWEPSARWASGGAGGGTEAYMFDDLSGKRTNCHILGYGQFLLTNSGVSIVYAENDTRARIEYNDMFATGGSTISCITWGSLPCELDIFGRGTTETVDYDAIYGDVSAGQKIRAHFDILKATGDLIELGGDAPEWNNVVISYRIGEQTVHPGQPTFMSVGGRTLIKAGQTKITSKVSQISDGGGVTNGIIEGGVFTFPPDGTFSPLGWQSPGQYSGYWLRGTVIEGPSNTPIANIRTTNGVPMVLENVSFKPGWASAYWITGSVASTVRIIGSPPALSPWKPFGGNITVDGNIKAIPNNTTPAAGQLAFFHDANTITNRPPIFEKGITNTGAFRNAGDATITGEATIGAANISGDLNLTGNFIGANASLNTLSLVNMTADSLIALNADNEVTNVVIGSGLTYTPSTRTLAATGGGASPGGSSAHIQFNQGGAFAGTNRFAYDRSNEMVRFQVPDTRGGIVVSNSANGQSVRLNSQGLMSEGAQELRFGVGANTNWIINTSGHFIPSADATYDQGAASLRLRTNWSTAFNGTDLYVAETTSLGTTNLGTNASVTFDLLGPAVGHYGISGNSTISLTNLVGFTNNTGGRYVDLHVRQFGVAGTLTISPVGPHPVDWGDGGLFIASGATNRLRILWDGLQLRGEVSHLLTTGSGAYVRSNAPSISTPNLLVSTTLRPASGSATTLKAAAGSALVTNVVGLVEKAAASVIEVNHNAEQDVSITNRISAATTIVLTNGFAGQQTAGLMLGEASGGTSRVITFVPQLGHLIANQNVTNATYATSYAETLAAGNWLEWSTVTKRMMGTNTTYIVTRQGLQ